MQSSPGSALHTNDLLQRVQNFRQIGLIGHDFINVLVSTGDFIDHTVIFAANHAPRLLNQIVSRELPFRSGSTHSPASSVRA